MKKKLLSLLLLVCVALCAFASCDMSAIIGGDSSKDSSAGTIEEVDYVSSLKLDMNSETLKQEVTVKNYIDGDTTHFNVPKTIDEFGLLKARYIGVNTPESTGAIEPWGKKAANFTNSKLKAATSIIIETDGTVWDKDSTGDRYLVWVWYKTADSTEYRNLNLEILQNGLAVGNKAGSSRYGEVCTNAISQAKALKLHVHSNAKDPDFYYGAAIEVDLKELRTNIAKYNGQRVAFEATVTIYDDWNVYLEDYDEITDRYYGITAFYGYNAKFHEILAPGNRARLVGKVSYYEAGGTYQISDLKYNPMKPTDANNTQKLSENNEAAYVETTLSQFNSTITIEKEEYDIVTGEDKVIQENIAYAELVISTSISMNNLTVIGAYTTNNGGKNNGAISLTCQDSAGRVITVRTAVLYDASGAIVTKDYFMNKTIDVKGIVDKFDKEYQIKVFFLGAITIHS